MFKKCCNLPVFHQVSHAHSQHNRNDDRADTYTITGFLQLSHTQFCFNHMRLCKSIHQQLLESRNCVILTIFEKLSENRLSSFQKNSKKTWFPFISFLRFVSYHSFQKTPQKHSSNDFSQRNRHIKGKQYDDLLHNVCDLFFKGSDHK